MWQPLPDGNTECTDCGDVFTAGAEACRCAPTGRAVGNATVDAEFAEDAALAAAAEALDVDPALKSLLTRVGREVALARQYSELEKCASPSTAEIKRFAEMRQTLSAIGELQEKRRLPAYTKKLEEAVRAALDARGVVSAEPDDMAPAEGDRSGGGLH